MEHVKSDVLASIEVWHTRAGTPTRRIALGGLLLPFEPVPGLGGVLIAAIVAHFAQQLSLEQRADVSKLLEDVVRDNKIPQPRLRYRYQTDRHGLGSSVHRIITNQKGGETSFLIEIEKEREPLPQVLGALYALERLDPGLRREMYLAIRRALNWEGGIDEYFLRHILKRGGDLGLEFVDSRSWALQKLGFTGNPREITKRSVARRYRELVLKAHPDCGGDERKAADEIAELGRARSILSV